MISSLKINWNKMITHKSLKMYINAVLCLSSKKSNIVKNIACTWGLLAKNHEIVKGIGELWIQYCFYFEKQN